MLAKIIIYKEINRNRLLQCTMEAILNEKIDKVIQHLILHKAFLISNLITLIK